MPQIKHLVVIIPALNEQKTIAKVVRAVPRRVGVVGKVSVVVVDDGSTDGTAKLARGAGADSVVAHPKNTGLGAAFRTGVEQALAMGADAVVNIDADMQFNPKDIPKLISPLLSGGADVVTCTRFKRRGFASGMPWIKSVGNRFFTALTNLLTRQNFTDTQCGFRAYSREACLRMSLFGRHTYTQEVLLDLLYKGFTVTEIPLGVKPQRDGASRVVSHWYVYGIKALVIILRTLRDHHPLKFFGGLGILALVLAASTALAFPTGMVTEGLTVLGLLMLALALIADMQDRQRKLTEELLYRQRKKELG